MVDIWKRIARKLPRIVLLQFGLITFRFHYGELESHLLTWVMQEKTKHPSNILFWEASTFHESDFVIVDGDRHIVKIRVLNMDSPSIKIWNGNLAVWDRYLSESMKCTCGSLNLWNEATLKRRSQETEKPIIFTYLFSATGSPPYPLTYRLPHLHQPLSWGIWFS